MAVGGFVFPDTTEGHSSEMLVVNLSLCKNGTLLMTDIWNLCIFSFSLSEKVHITFLCCIPNSGVSHIPNFISSSGKVFNCMSK